jgi:hypothetical protein
VFLRFAAAGAAPYNPPALRVLDIGASVEASMSIQIDGLSG